jgi:hypothetical protein
MTDPIGVNLLGGHPAFTPSQVMSSANWVACPSGGSRYSDDSGLGRRRKPLRTWS